MGDVHDRGAVLRRPGFGRSGRAAALLFTLFSLRLLSCSGTHAEHPATTDEPEEVVAFYRIVIFLDSSLPRAPASFVTEKNAPSLLSDFRHTGAVWWRCRDPGSPSATLPEECLANTGSFGADDAWWHAIAPPRIKQGSHLQLLFLNTSRDAALEGKRARVTVRFRRTDRSSTLDGENPLAESADALLPPVRASYGGVDAPAWGAPSFNGFFGLDKVGRYELKATFEPEGGGDRFLAAAVVEVTP